MLEQAIMARQDSSHLSSSVLHMLGTKVQAMPSCPYLAIVLGKPIPTKLVHAPESHLICKTNAYSIHYHVLACY